MAAVYQRVSFGPPWMRCVESCCRTGQPSPERGLEHQPSSRRRWCSARTHRRRRAAGKTCSSAGSSSCRTRLRRNRGSSLLGSTMVASASASQYATTSARHTRRSGRASLPVLSAIADRALGVAPASARISTVSAWSSAVCAKAMAVAPTSSARRWRAAWRASRARSWREDPRAATLTESAVKGRLRAAAAAATRPGSTSEPARSPWSTWATWRVSRRGGASRASASRSDVEVRATAARHHHRFPVGEHTARVERDGHRAAQPPDSGRALVRLQRRPVTAHRPPVVRRWWRHLDSNQGHTGYEPGALPTELCRRNRRAIVGEAELRPPRAPPGSAVSPPPK